MRKDIVRRRPSRPAQRGIAALAVAAAGAALLAAPAASAAPRPQPLLKDLADVVVRGHVAGAGTAVTPGVNSPVDTLLPFAVEGTLQGTAAPTVLVRVHGGTVAPGRTLFVSEEPELVAGDRAVLFLRRTADGTYRVVLGERGVVDADEPHPLAEGVNHCLDSDGSGFSGFNAAHRWNGNGFTFVLGTSALTYQATIDAAANTWNTAGTAFHATDGGLDPTVSGPYQFDGKNAVNVTNIGADDGALARTYWWASGSTFIEADINFNTYYPLSTAPSSSQYDLQSLGTHELGHAVGLGHVQDTGQVMYPCIAAGAIKRTLGFGDVSGVRNVYPPDTQGYYLLDRTGAVFGLGGANSARGSAAPYYGGANQGNVVNYPTSTAVDIEVHRPTRAGYWILGSNGGVYSYGDAPFRGNALANLCGGCHAVAMASTPSGDGYWILGSDGGVFSYGDAAFYGSAAGAFPAGAYATSIAARPNGTGYWVLNNLGQVYAFPNGYMGGCACVQPASSIESTASGNGYWILGGNGQIYTFGDAPNLGSAVGWGSPETLSRHPLSNGYEWTAPNGDVSTHGTTFYGRGTIGTFAAMAATDLPIAPRLTISGPGSMTVKRGACGSGSFSASSNNTFRATVNVSASGAPSGSSASVSPSSFLLEPSSSRSGTLTVCAGATQTTGFTVTLSASGSNGTSASTTVSVTVQLI